MMWPLVACPTSAAGRPYNYAVTSSASARLRPSLWARIAAFLSFLAVMSALAAPVSMLADEVRTGKLGGLCSLNIGSQGSPDSDAAGAGGSVKAAAHCELCGSLGLAPPSWPVVRLPCDLCRQLADVSAPARRGKAVSGLPFSRGPPAF